MTAIFCLYYFILLFLCTATIALKHQIAPQTYKHDYEQFKKVYTKYLIQQEKHTTSLIIRKTKIKTTMEYYFTLTKMAKCKSGQ